VYALGAIFYEMLTGVRPRYDAQVAHRLGTPSTSGSEVRKHLEAYARHLEDCEAPAAHRAVKGVDAPIAGLIDRCLDTNFDDRPKDAIAVEQLIRDCERQARMRKLVRFGGWAPAIMLLAVGLVSLVAGLFTLQRFEDAWTKNVNETNGAIAEAIKNSVAARFQSQMRLVQEQAASPQLVELMQRRPQPHDAEALGILTQLFDDYRDTTGPAQTARWSLANADGLFINNYGRLTTADVGVDRQSNGKNFAWRGWFNGEEDRPETERAASGANWQRDTDLFRQRRRTHAFVSQPYRRQGAHEIPVINVTCPIAEADDAVPIGILAAQIYYPEFLDEVTRFVSSEASRKRNIVILNHRYQVIYSQQLAAAASPADEARGSTHPQFVIEKYAGQPHFQQALSGRDDLGEYVDPQDGQSYLGSSRRVDLGNGQSLAIIVQQEQAAALGKLAAIRFTVMSAFVALIGVGGLCLCLNVFALRREAASHA
jgi:hypothetical protein